MTEPTTDPEALGNAFPAGPLTAAAAIKLASDAQKLVEHLEDFERRRLQDRRVYLVLLVLTALFAGTAAGFGIYLSQLTHISKEERLQVLEHRDRNEVSHDALCRQMNRIAEQARLTPIACPSPLRFAENP